MAHPRPLHSLLVGLLLLTTALAVSTGFVAPVASSNGDAPVNSSTPSTVMPDATATSTSTIDISVTDSSNGQDNVSVPITVDSQPPDGVPTDLPESVSSEQYSAWAGSDGELSQNDVITGFNDWFSNGSSNGVTFGQQAALDLFNYWFSS